MLRSHCKISKEEAHSMPNSIKVGLGVYKRISHHFRCDRFLILFIFWTLLFIKPRIFALFGANFASYVNTLRHRVRGTAPPRNCDGPLTRRAPSDDDNDIFRKPRCLFVNIRLYVAPAKTISSNCFHVLKAKHEDNLSGWGSQRRNAVADSV